MVDSSFRISLDPEDRMSLRVGLAGTVFHNRPSIAEPKHCAHLFSDHADDYRFADNELIVTLSSNYNRERSGDPLQWLHGQMIALVIHMTEYDRFYNCNPHEVTCTAAGIITIKLRGDRQDLAMTTAGLLDIFMGGVYPALRIEDTTTITYTYEPDEHTPDEQFATLVRALLRADSQASSELHASRR